MKGDVAGHRFNVHTDTCVRCGLDRWKLIQDGWPDCEWVAIIAAWLKGKP